MYSPTAIAPWVYRIEANALQCLKQRLAKTAAPYTEKYSFHARSLLRNHARRFFLPSKVPTCARMRFFLARAAFLYGFLMPVHASVPKSCGFRDNPAELEMLHCSTSSFGAIVYCLMSSEFRRVL